MSIGTSTSKFSSAVDGGRIKVSGAVKSGLPFITRIGSFNVELAIEVRKGGQCEGVWGGGGSWCVHMCLLRGCEAGWLGRRSLGKNMKRQFE